MQSYNLLQPLGPDTAVAYARLASTSFIAGGTDLLQLMKVNVDAPRHVVDLSGLDLRAITTDEAGLHLGALATMADVAGHESVRSRWPVISEALLLSASPQVRNMGTMAGNLLQRTRCNYFRDTGFDCNKRVPGSGCPAIVGRNRDLAVFGGSGNCIATHPSDLPVALIALGAIVHIQSAERQRHDVALSDFYRLPDKTPHIETVLQPGDLILGLTVPNSGIAKNSRYLKVRDRTSFAFALVSAAVALDVEDGSIRDARVALGGVAPMPWRLPAVEAALRGNRLNDALLTRAASMASDGAKPASENAFKLDLVRQTVLRALQLVAA
jgi:xanthine dehydrogenase YagS FAD-binding subunit